MIANSALLKVVLLGESSVGKTALMKMYCEKKFDKPYQATIGADFLTKEMAVGEKAITMQIWDTAGQERFKSLVCRFYRGADACILVYDITNAQSFERLDFWMGEFVEHADIKDPSRFPFLVVGNKHDLHDQSKVSESKAKAWCKSKGNIRFLQTSAKVNHNVEQAFTKVVELALEIQSDFEDIYNTDVAPLIQENDLRTPKNLENQKGFYGSLQNLFSPRTADAHDDDTISVNSGISLQRRQDEPEKGIIQLGQEYSEGALSWLERNDCC